VFHVYVGKYLSRKAVHSWVADGSGDHEVQITVKRFLYCRFQRTDKAMGQMYPCWWKVCREIKVFSGFNYHMFYVLYTFVTYLLTLPCRMGIRDRRRKSQGDNRKITKDSSWTVAPAEEEESLK
jgi:hypothetical protein